jgi:hypothetical protein
MAGPRLGGAGRSVMATEGHIDPAACARELDKARATISLLRSDPETNVATGVAVIDAPPRQLLVTCRKASARSRRGSKQLRFREDLFSASR